MARGRKPKTDAPYPPGWEPFLAAIKAEMFDDTARLVFADWLDENGDSARSELIRTQCGLMGMHPDEPNVRELGARCESLVAENWQRWTVGFPRVTLNDTPPHFVRGFISYAALTATQLLKHGAALTRLTPIDNLQLMRATPDSLRTQTLGQVGGLYITPVDSARVKALASNPHLSLLRQLFVSNGFDEWSRPTAHIGQESVAALLANTSLFGLQRFELNGTKHGDVVADGIAAGAFTRLEELRLYRSDVSASGLKAIVNSASAASLTNLHLAGNHFGNTGIWHLVEAPALTRLECLNFMDCGVTAHSMKLLADWPGLRTVRSFQLGASGLTEADAYVIRASPYAVSLKQLSVRP